MMEHVGGGKSEANEVARLDTHKDVTDSSHYDFPTPDSYKLGTKMEDIGEVTRVQNVESGLVPTGDMASGTNKAEPDMREAKKSEPLSENLEVPPVFENYKLDTGMEAREVTGAESVDSKELLTEEMAFRMKEAAPAMGGADKSEPLSENVKVPSALGNIEVPLHNGLTDLENTDIPPGTAYLCPCNGRMESMEKDVINDPSHFEDENKTPAHVKKRKSKLKSPVTSSWNLRSKSQEKPKANEPNVAANEGSANGEKRRRGRKKRRVKNNKGNELSRMRTHLKYLLNRIQYEQSLIDAYSAEGWKGQSLEKLKPEKELQRAKSHIVHYKLRIRELFQHLDSLLEEGNLPEALFDDQGEIDSEDIFCAKCGSKDLPLDNDIILCDGACERGFHQFCLEPPLLKEHIPPDDEGWLCPVCDCKDDCIDMLNDFQGTHMSIVDKWEKIFPEAASGMNLDGGSSSDDSDDDNYDLDKPDMIEKAGGVGSSSDNLVNSDNYMGLPSEDSEDDDFDPISTDPDTQVKQDSSSSDFTSDSEDLGALLDDATAPGEDPEHVSPSSEPNQQCTFSNRENSKVGRTKRQSLTDELSHLMENSDEPVVGQRHVQCLDYKKLYDETYGNSSSDSSDEDYIDSSAPKRRKINRQRTDATFPNKTPTTDNKLDTAGKHLKESHRLPKRTRKNKADGSVSESSATVGSTHGSTERSAHKRLGEAVTQRLYESFGKNQYLKRAVKEQLANELGLTIQQVAKWFENARRSFNHRRQMDSNVAEKPPEPRPTTDTDHKSIPNENRSAEALPGNVAANTTGETSGSLKSRKRKSGRSGTR